MNQLGKGSTLVVYDLYLDEKSNLDTALSPKRLHAELERIIGEVGMLQRKGLLDVWDSEDYGPATSFHSLSESHSRNYCAPEFNRVETWPGEQITHVQGEVQLCNFSRNNEDAAKLFACLVIELLKPVSAEILVIYRGPGQSLRPAGSTIMWYRGMPRPF